MESKREEFRKYLEKGGVLQAINFSLARLYEMAERPNNPLEFIARRLQHCVDTSRLDSPLEESPLERESDEMAPRSAKTADVSCDTSEIA